MSTNGLQFVKALAEDPTAERQKRNERIAQEAARQVIAVNEARKQAAKAIIYKCNIVEHGVAYRSTPVMSDRVACRHC